MSVVPGQDVPKSWGETPAETRARLCRVDAMKGHFALFEQTMHLTRLGHRRQLYNERPYWHHPARVMLRLWHPEIGTSEAYGVWFHDLVEDNNSIFKAENLSAFGYQPATIKTVNLVTRDESLTYAEYINNICTSDNIPALRIKAADLYENTNNIRFLPGEKRGRIERYGKAIPQVLAALIAAYSKIGMIAAPIISGELDATEVEHWIGELPSFL